MASGEMVVGDGDVWWRFSGGVLVVASCVGPK